MYKPTIKTFYNHQQVMESNIQKSYSKSPLKPKLLLKHLKRLGFYDGFLEFENFRPFDESEFLIAHSNEYVNAFFKGIKPLCSSNGVPWSEELVKSVCYTNSSLYNAMRYASQNSEYITFSPTSGFHHSSPEQGSGFCTFSGQVIASVKLYREFGLRTAWLDLDGHFGNSIEDSRYYVPDLNLAVPLGYNVNPTGQNQEYLNSLKANLEFLEEAILNNQIDCVVWAHGADSHEDDDLGGSCSTDEWYECSEMFYKWVKQLNAKRNKPLPVTLTLFGGYRKDDYTSVLELHASDIVQCLHYLCGREVEHFPDVRRSSFGRL